MSEQMFSAGTLYEANKQLNNNEKILSRTELKAGLKKAKMFFANQSDKYFMLLCRERNDYTLFSFYNKNDITLQHSSKDLEECLTNRGLITSIEETENRDAMEIWLKIDDDSYVYYLFPYSMGVIEEGVEEI